MRLKGVLSVDTCTCCFLKIQLRFHLFEKEKENKKKIKNNLNM